MKNREDVENEELENFDEAIKAANTALQPTKIASDTEKILNAGKCSSLDSKSDNFWVIARAVKDFVDDQDAHGGRGQLPVRGTLPDMFSDSERYIKLLNIYRNKASSDSENIFKRVQSHLEHIGRPVVRKRMKITRVINKSAFSRSR